MDGKSLKRASSVMSSRVLAYSWETFFCPDTYSCLVDYSLGIFQFILKGEVALTKKDSH